MEIYFLRHLVRLQRSARAVSSAILCWRKIKSSSYFLWTRVWCFLMSVLHYSRNVICMPRWTWECILDRSPNVSYLCHLSLREEWCDHHWHSKLTWLMIYSFSATRASIVLDSYHLGLLHLSVPWHDSRLTQPSLSKEVFISLIRMPWNSHWRLWFESRP